MKSGVDAKPLSTEFGLLIRKPFNKDVVHEKKSPIKKRSATFIPESRLSHLQIVFFFIVDRVVDLINIKSFLKSRLKDRNKSDDLKYHAERHVKFIHNLLNLGENEKDIM